MDKEKRIQHADHCRIGSMVFVVMDSDQYLTLGYGRVIAKNINERGDCYLNIPNPLEIYSIKYPARINKCNKPQLYTTSLITALDYIKEIHSEASKLLIDQTKNYIQSLEKDLKNKKNDLTYLEGISDIIQILEYKDIEKIFQEKITPQEAPDSDDLIEQL